MSDRFDDYLVPLVGLHEVFWSDLMQRNPRSRVMRTFFVKDWTPFFDRYVNEWQIGNTSDETTSALMRALMKLRDLASAFGIPAPKLNDAQLDKAREAASTPPARVGGRGGASRGGRGGFRAPSFAAPARHAPAPARVQHFRNDGRRYDDRGHWGQGGFYRHGSRWPGRWWYAVGYAPIWVEAEINLTAPDVNPLDLPPPTLAEVPLTADADAANANANASEAAAHPASDQDGAVTDENAAYDETTDAGDQEAEAISSGQAPVNVNPIVQNMNLLTDQLFWDQTNYKRGHRLNRRDPADAKMIPIWLSIRYQVARDFAGLNRADEDRQISSDTGPQIPTYEPTNKTEEAPMNQNAIISGRARTTATTMPDRLASIAPVIAPTARPMTVSLALDGTVLNASICINGVCETGSIDLGAMVDNQIRVLHPQLHEQPRTLMGALIDPMAADPDAARALVGALVDRHEEALCAGWWSSLKHSVSSAAGSVAHTLSTLKGPISMAAQTAATSAGMALGGPAGAALASSLAGSIVSAAATGAPQAKAVVAQATQLAQSDPQIAKALGAARKAAAQATAGYHVVQTVANAAAGNPDAIQQVQELTASAAAGDPAAQAAVDLAQQASPDQASTAVSGASPYVDAHVWRAEAQSAGPKIKSLVYAYVKPKDGPSQFRAFESSDDADDWCGRWATMPHAIEYTAYFNKGQGGAFPAPENEWIGRADTATVSGHWLLPMLLGAGVGAGVDRFGGRGYRWLRDKLHTKAA